MRLQVNCGDQINSTQIAEMVCGRCLVNLIITF